MRTPSAGRRRRSLPPCHSGARPSPPLNLTLRAKARPPARAPDPREAHSAPCTSRATPVAPSARRAAARRPPPPPSESPQARAAVMIPRATTTSRFATGFTSASPPRRMGECLAGSIPHASRRPRPAVAGVSAVARQAVAGQPFAGQAIDRPEPLLVRPLLVRPLIALRPLLVSPCWSGRCWSVPLIALRPLLVRPLLVSRCWSGVF